MIWQYLLSNGIRSHFHGCNENRLPNLNLTSIPNWTWVVIAGTLDYAIPSDVDDIADWNRVVDTDARNVIKDYERT